MRVVDAIKADMRFQYRHGFYGAYLVITVFYILLLRLLPPEPAAFMAPVVLFTDPAVLGFFFVGGLVLFERKQNLLEGFLVTPLKPAEYLVAKMASLLVITMATSLAIIWLGVRGPFNLYLLVLGVALTAPFFTLAGFVIALKSRSINGFFLTSVLLTPLFAIPLLEYFGVFTHPLFYLIPGRGGILLIAGSLGFISSAETALSIMSLTIWLIIAFLWTKRCYYRFIMEGGGPV